jgi:two-component system chemotaxis response regulator CheY
VKGTVLIVDDIAMMRSELRRILEEYGMTVVGEAENGRAGVEAYARLKPQVVLLDITMPEMDGLTALKEIRRQDPAARVVMCSALGQQRYLLAAIRSGARDFVVKPFNPERIAGAIRKALQDNR